MLATDLTAALTYAELAAIVDENGEPFESVAQCDLYLRAASMLRRRVPEEADHSGERIRTRDLLEGMKEARKVKAILSYTGRAHEVIVPTDELR